MHSDVASPGMRFFVLKKLNEGPHRAEFDRTSDHFGEGQHCPQCGEPIGSLSWEPPYQGELELYGRAFGDLLMGPGGLLVTEQFAAAFTAEGLTGLSGFHPVEVLRVVRRHRSPKPGAPPRYLFVTQAWGQTALDLERSRMRISKPRTCAWCRDTNVDAIDGLALEEGTWGGEDVFRPRGLWGVILVSERFMRFAQRHACTNFSFIPIDKYVWDPLGHFYPWEQRNNPPGKS
jgi:hypothetical protein